jgi:RNA-directed DNA polymerase
MTTQPVSLIERARRDPRTRFTAVMQWVYDEAALRASFARQDGRKAPGVDGMSKADYAEDVEARLSTLSQSLRQMGWRPKPTRRVMIPKGDGRMRPLGLPSFEDRLVQDGVARVLGAIWESEFRDCSYGFRPGRSAHDALRRLHELLTVGGMQWVVEADIEGFFDHVGHTHLMRFVEHRVADTRLLRLIRRFLKAGVLADGAYQATTQGTPQGGLVSPVLSNIYLHYVLDLWFEKRFARSCQGRAALVRYADDFVACFEYESDARRFREELPRRMADFALRLAESKTALRCFGSRARAQCRRLGLRRPETFTFLGFTHYVSRTRHGRYTVGRKTSGVRMRRQLTVLSGRLRALRIAPGSAMLIYLRRHLQGYLQYYGVSGNLRCVRNYFYRARRLLHHWINRRSQRRSVSWARLGPVLDARLPVPRILHSLYAPPPRIEPAGSRMV